MSSCYFEEVQGILTRIPEFRFGYFGVRRNAYGIIVYIDNTLNPELIENIKKDIIEKVPDDYPGKVEFVECGPFELG